MNHHDRIWTSLLEADFRSHYFGHLAGRLQREERFLALAVTILSSSAFLSLVAKFQWIPSSAAAALSALAAVAGAILAVQKPGKKAAQSGALHRRWSSACRELESLWMSLYRLDPEEAVARWKAIEDEYAKDSESASVEFPRARRLAALCQREVVRNRRLVLA